MKFLIVCYYKKKIFANRLKIVLKKDRGIRKATGSEDFFMKTASYLSRVGGFVSVNTGSIRDCYTEAKIKYENNAAGFAFENTGEVARSVSQGQTAGKENIAGFCCRNKGTITNAGWLCSAETSEKNSYVDTRHAVPRPSLPLNSSAFS